MMSRSLKLAAPYVAVIVFWVGYENAWLAILAYHAQMLFWARKSLGRNLGGWSTRRMAAVTLPAALAGPLLVVLLPQIARTAVAEWLGRYGLAGPTLFLMIPYFGIVHPILEQTHWAELRRNSMTGHAAFAGYHAIVLYTLLPPLWLALTAGVLTVASVAWERTSAGSRGLLVAMGSHVVADLGIVTAAWMLT